MNAGRLSDKAGSCFVSGMSWEVMWERPLILQSQLDLGVVRNRDDQLSAARAVEVQLSVGRPLGRQDRELCGRRAEGERLPPN